MTLFLLCSMTYRPATAADSEPLKLRGLIGQSAETGFREYLDAVGMRAFAIAPDGAWAWVGDRPTSEIAETEALASCGGYTEQPCQLYAVNEDVVLDETAWRRSWVFDVDDVPTSDVGVRRGDVFPDLTFTSSGGKLSSVGVLKGRPVFVHFWGSWCPPCLKEFPDIQKLYDNLKADHPMAFVLLQAREPLARSKRWAAKRGVTLPLSDSGHASPKDRRYALSNGTEIDERRLAGVYPSTYILDAQGRVVFGWTGPVEDWLRYELFIRELK